MAFLSKPNGLTFCLSGTNQEVKTTFELKFEALNKKS